MYLSDKPILDASEDLLGRHNYAQLLSKTLINLDNSNTFTIGVFGKWGSGKTSIVNMALTALAASQSEEKEKIRVIRFEPWHFTNNTDLMSQFLVRLAAEYTDKKEKTKKSIGTLLLKYANAFDFAKLIPVPVLNDVIASGGKKITNHLGNKMIEAAQARDILSLKEKIIVELNKLKQKTLVVIDDIDRLTNEQIRQVFQLVSSVAKFPNITYLLIFDKDIVVNALNKVQTDRGEDYLEKIIQISIPVPKIKESKLHTILFNKLDSLLTRFPDLKISQEHWNHLFYQLIDKKILTLRDINRLYNSLLFKLSCVSGEIDFSDLIAITTLEMKAPQIYEWIKNNKIILTGDLDYSSIGKAKKEKTQNYDEYLNHFTNILPGSDSYLKKSEAKYMMEVVSSLFPAFADKVGLSHSVRQVDSGRKNNLIYVSEKFDRYFDFDVNSISCTQEIISQLVFKHPSDIIATTLLDFEKSGNAYELLQEIEERVKDIDDTRKAILIDGILLATNELYLNSKPGFLTRNDGSFAVILIYSILERLKENCYNTLASLVNNATLETIEPISEIINMIELGYGRLFANGSERSEYKKIVTEQELEEIEFIYAQKCDELLKSNHLPDFPRWRLMTHMMKKLKENSIDEFFENELKDNKNIIIYLQELISHWIGTGVSYEVREPDKYITKNNIIDAIEQVIQTKELFSLPDTAQKNAAAYYLYHNKEVGFDGHVTGKSVDELLSAWKCER